MNLLPGDALLYVGTGWFSRAIQVKTFSRFSHIEVFVGDEQSVASRDGVGVGRYPLRTDDLRAVLRPHAAVDIAAALAWFETVKGQPYDVMGLFNFFVARWRGQENGAMFCSEFATRFYRAGGFHPFSDSTDADTVAPGEFAKSPVFDHVTVL